MLKLKSRKFSVRLLKKGYVFDDICKDGIVLEPISQDDIYSVYLVVDKPHSPWWKDYLDIQSPLLNQSSSAILTVNVEGRIFVYTFGCAHTKLKQEYFEEKFGFLVTINSIDGEKLKSIDAYSPANNTKQKRVVSSIVSNIYEYDFNDSQDLIQRLSGIIKPEYKDLFTNPTGADSLSIHSKMSKSELIDVSRTLLERFYSEDYKKDIYLKNINKVNRANAKQSEELYRILIDKLNKHDFSDICMADFEILDLDQFYVYKFNGRELLDLSIEQLDLGNDLTLEKLKSFKISVLKTQDDHHPIQWSLYKCLVFDHKNTFLSKGIVYEIKQDFLDEVKTFTDQYRIPNFLPDARVGEKEQEYNERIQNQNDFILLDRKCPNIDGYNRVEICDIYNKLQKQFIHIKKAESSSSLSHLWNQGVVSEQLANSNNLKYLEKFEEVVGEQLPKERKIYFGIIKKSPQLPIFSMISLYNNIKILRGMGKSENEIKYFYIGIRNA